MPSGPGLGTLLKEIDPHWLPDIDPGLLASGRETRLGRQVLLRCLAIAPIKALFAPSPEPVLDRVATAWPRDRLDSFLLNLGVLAFAPAIRAEIGREPVRRLKAALDKRYLLALDRQMWDGQVPPALLARLQERLGAAVSDPDPSAMLRALFARHGRAELRQWGAIHEPALADWVLLLYPADPGTRGHLPAGAVARLHAHHAAAPAGEA